jgi:hypothetical protein
MRVILTGNTTTVEFELKYISTRVAQLFRPPACRSKGLRFNPRADKGASQGATSVISPLRDNKESIKYILKRLLL